MTVVSQGEEQKANAADPKGSVLLLLMILEMRLGSIWLEVSLEKRRRGWFAECC